MDRRAFLKWLAGAAVLAAGGGMWQWLKPGENQLNAADSAAAAGGTAAPSPSAGSNAGAAAAGSPAGTGELLTFFVISDLHINPDIPEHTRHVKMALDDIVAYPKVPDALVITGDLCDYGREKDYRLLRSTLQGYKLPPIHANMGNHDYYNIWIDEKDNFNQDTMPNGKSDELSRQAFTRFFSLQRVYHDFWIGGCHFIMLSQDTYVQEKSDVGEGAWYSDDQLDWFRTKMAEPTDGKPMFVMIHQPLPAKGTDGGSHQLIRAKKFREILKPYPNVFVFSGHRHQDFRWDTQHYTRETFHWFNNASINRIINRSPNPPDTTRSAQGMYVQVYADKVLLRGREFSDRSWFKQAQWEIPLERV